MKTGVSTVPWANVSTPRRAAPHRAVTWNSIAAIVQTHAISFFRRDARRRREAACGAATRLRAGARIALDEHRVAVAEKAVALTDRVRVRGANRHVAGKGGHQHHQRRPRQMEVGQQAVDDAKAESGGDEE